MMYKGKQRRWDLEVGAMCSPEVFLLLALTTRPWVKMQHLRSMFHCFHHFGGSSLYSCFSPLASCLFLRAICNYSCLWSWVNNLFMAAFWRRKEGVYIFISICTYTPHATHYASLCKYSGYSLESQSTGPVQSTSSIFLKWLHIKDVCAIILL